MMTTMTMLLKDIDDSEDNDDTYYMCITMRTMSLINLVIWAMHERKHFFTGGVPLYCCKYVRRCVACTYTIHYN